MLVIFPDAGFHSTASLPTVLFGQENSSTFPVCSMTAWMETRVRLNGLVHDPVTAGSAATGRARAAGPPSMTAVAPPATRNWRREKPASRIPTPVNYPPQRGRTGRAVIAGSSTSRETGRYLTLRVLAI